MTITPHRSQRTGAAPHRGHFTDRFSRFEGLADYATVGAIVVFALAMGIGLLTSSGTSPWY